MSTVTELVPLEQLNPVDVFTPIGTTEILERIMQEVKSAVTDISTPAGRKHVASLANQVAKSKVFLDEAGKRLTEQWKTQSAVVDRERKRIRDTLDALKAEVRKPLTEWEEREEKRIQSHEVALLGFPVLMTFTEPHPSSEMAADRLTRCDTLFASRDWEEFAKRADLACGAAKLKLATQHAASVQHESEQAELARLRQEAIERQQRERDERLQREAAEKARLEAEAKAKAEADAEAARVKAEADRLAAQAKAERDKIEAERLAAEKRVKDAEAKALAEAKAAQERAAKVEADRVAAKAKAEADAKAAHEKAQAEAKATAEKHEREKAAAIQAERDRQTRETKAKADAAAKREADQRHCADINNRVVADLVSRAGLSEEAAKAVVTAIAKLEIRHTRISY